MKETISWMKKELLKSPDKIDWLSIAEKSKKLYKEINDKESFLGISKGFVNLVRTSIYDTKEIISDIQLVYPTANIRVVKYCTDINKLIKNGDIKTLLEEDVPLILLTDRATVEMTLPKNQIPYLKFSATKKSKSTVDVNGKRTYERSTNWKKAGEKPITWKTGGLVSIKRDNILELIFNED